MRDCPRFYWPAHRTQPAQWLRGKDYVLGENVFPENSSFAHLAILPMFKTSGRNATGHEFALHACVLARFLQESLMNETTEWGGNLFPSYIFLISDFSSTPDPI